jgi:hypothetical protein
MSLSTSTKVGIASVFAIRKGIAMHIAGLKEDGLPIPAPTTTAERIAVAA